MASPSKASITGGTFIVSGLSEWEKALKVASPALHKELRLSLKRIAEPVAQDAQTLAQYKIPGMRAARRRARSREGVPWSEMRVGVTQSFVYIAPKQRGVKTRGPDPRRRPNLVGLMMGRALEPAAVRHEVQVEADVAVIVDGVSRMLETI